MTFSLYSGPSRWMSTNPTEEVKKPSSEVVKMDYDDYDEYYEPKTAKEKVRMSSFPFPVPHRSHLRSLGGMVRQTLRNGCIPWYWKWVSWVHVLQFAPQPHAPAVAGLRGLRQDSHHA